MREGAESLRLPGLKIPPLIAACRRAGPRKLIDGTAGARRTTFRRIPLYRSRAARPATPVAWHGRAVPISALRCVRINEQEEFGR